LDFPNLCASNTYALEICGETMERIYRKGDIDIVSSDSAVLLANRVVVKNRNGEIVAKQLIKMTIWDVRLVWINQAHREIVIPRQDVE
jgi:phage repressor protein C with HTH and peptisase S24 domain